MAIFTLLGCESKVPTDTNNQVSSDGKSDSDIKHEDSATEVNGCPNPNFTGEECDQCLPGFYGELCRPCPDCGDHGSCVEGKYGSGICACEEGWIGAYCDLPAIVNAHNYANQYNLCVKAKSGATYYIGDAPQSAIIKTNTDWTWANWDPLIYAYYTGKHNFGYESYLPTIVDINGLYVRNWFTVYIFGDVTPDNTSSSFTYKYPLHLTEKVIMRNYSQWRNTTLFGSWELSENSKMFRNVIVDK